MMVDLATLSTAVIGLLLTSVLVVLVLYFTYPALLIATFKRYSIFSCGQKVKYVTIGGYRMCYAERGQPSLSPQKPTLVFLHGYTGSKSTWTGAVNNLPKDVHIICIDFPGHGDSECNPETDLSIDGLTTKLRQFFELTGLTKYGVHLLGRSMGGNVAACYAATHPEKISLLSLQSPIVRTPELSRALQDFSETGNNPFIDSSDEAFREVLRLGLNVDVLPFPAQIINGTADLRRPHFVYWKPLFESMANDVWLGEEDLCFGKICDQIHAPTQIIWAEKDQVAHPDGAEYLKERLPNCRRVDIVEGKGHGFPFGEGRKMADLIMEFRRAETENHYVGYVANNFRTTCLKKTM